MSYQQYPPGSGAQPGMQQPWMQQPGAAFAPTPAPTSRRPALIGLGALVLAVGVVTGTVLVLAASSNYDESVKNLARAPIGCVTDLEFTETGTYWVYVETRGRIADLRGDCPNTDTDFDSSGGDLPDVDIVVVDDSGDEVRLEDDDSKSYDAAGFIGQSVARLEIDEPGDFELTATSDTDQVAVAIGRSPRDDAASLRTTGLVVLVGGVVLGVLLLAVGLRRRPAVGPGAPAGGSFVPAGPPAGVAPSSQTPMPPMPPMPPTTTPPTPTVAMPPTAPPRIPMPPSPPPPPPGVAEWPAPPSS